MEADDFFSGYEALQDASRSIQLTLCDPCPVTKIVWSSFDHITGPELRFVWEIVAAANLTPVALSTNSESTKDESTSITSSISRDTNSAAYEDIDDVLQPSESERPQYLDEFMMESRSTLEGATTLTEDEEGLSHLMTSFASSSQFTEEDTQSESTSKADETVDFENLFKRRGLKAASALSSPARLLTRGEERSSGNGACTGPEMIDFGTDPLTANSLSKSLENSSASSIHDESRTDAEDNTETSKQEFLKQIRLRQSVSSVLSTRPHTHEDSARIASFESEDGGNEEVPQGFLNSLTTSAVDSGINGTVSAHSDLSVFCNSPPFMDSAYYGSSYGANVGLLTSDLYPYWVKGDEGYVEDERTDIERSFSMNESVDYDTLMEMSGESTSVQPTDDEFIAKLVLTDQVYSLQLPSNSLMHKVSIVPKRRILIGSYLFPVSRAGDGKNVTCAVSIVAPDSKLEWYMKRQNVIEEMFTDITPRLKASYFSESLEDVICRMRTEFERMLSILGSAERFSLCSSLEEVKIHHTHLFDSKLQDNVFLARAITGLLRSQSHCVIVGDQRAAVLKLLNTLSFFVPKEWRWCSLKCYKQPYSPYLRLQAISRSELPLAISAGVESHWPIAVIDVDKRLVCISSNYLKHRRIKQRRQRNDVAGILISAGIDTEINDTRQNKLEMRNCHASNSVVEFLAKMDFLPYERNARTGFLRQFLLSIENRARAFITYVQDASKPNASDKSSAVSSRWSLSAARSALDLSSESSFSIVLAEAERLESGISDFICDTRSF